MLLWFYEKSNCHKTCDIRVQGIVFLCVKRIFLVCHSLMPTLHSSKMCQEIWLFGIFFISILLFCYFEFHPDLVSHIIFYFNYPNNLHIFFHIPLSDKGHSHHKQKKVYDISYYGSMTQVIYVWLFNNFFGGGHLRVPPQCSDLVMPAAWGGGRGTRVDNAPSSPHLAWDW